MSKKHYFVLAPSSYEDEVRAKALHYYGSKEYEEILKSPKLLNMFENITPNSETINIDLMLVAISLMAISQCDSVYISRHWNDDDYCKICQALAFSHGLDIVYEPI